MNFIATSEATVQAVEGYIVRYRDDGLVFYLAPNGHALLNRSNENGQEIIEITKAAWRNGDPMDEDSKSKARDVIREACLAFKTPFHVEFS